MEVLKTDIIDGKEVIVKSQIQELDYGILRREIDRVNSEMEHCLSRVALIKEDYAKLQKAKDFYTKELEKLEPKHKEDIFDIL